jgi:hypothetical protein
MTEVSKKIPDFAPLDWPDDYLMSRREAAALSVAFGRPVAAGYLAKLFCVSTHGPLTVRFGRRARIRVADFKAWLDSRTSAPRRSTSEADAARAGAGREAAA